VSRPLWFPLNNKRETVGRVYICDGFGWREIMASPLRRVNPGDIAFTMLGSTLRDFGVITVEVTDAGGVNVKLQFSDSYGRVVREIARAYFLALNSPNPRRPIDE